MTILFGGLTWKHERVIQAVFEGCGYRCEILPVPDVAGFQLGKEYGNNGQCNPNVFHRRQPGEAPADASTVSRTDQAGDHQQLRLLHRRLVRTMPLRHVRIRISPGLAERRIRRLSACCLFQQNDGVKAASGEAGLKFTVDFGMGMFNALNLGDIMNEMIYPHPPVRESKKARPTGSSTKPIDTLCTMLRERKPFEDHEDLPGWMAERIKAHKGEKWEIWVNSLLKVREQLYGNPYKEALQAVHEQLGTIEVDRLRVKPVVKIIGEFWAQITEGDGNFHMFEFLEREGAQVLVEPIGTWVMYMMYQVKARAAARRSLDAPYKKVKRWELHKLAMNELKFRQKQWMIGVGERVYAPAVSPRRGGAGQHRPSPDRPEGNGRAGEPLLQRVRARR